MRNTGPLPQTTVVLYPSRRDLKFYEFPQRPEFYGRSGSRATLLDSAELADPAVRAEILGATDLPPEYWGDLRPSLYPLCREIRQRVAVGLEVRVPFCDHRLTDYVFNVPWAMKSFDGREKSLLRAATRDVLPNSILERTKTPLSATRDARYEQAHRAELREVLTDPDSPVRPLLNTTRVTRVLNRELEDVSLPHDRGGLEMALWLNRWLTSYDVTVDV